MELFLSALVEFLVGEVGKSVLQRLSNSQKAPSAEPFEPVSESSLLTT